MTRGLWAILGAVLVSGFLLGGGSAHATRLEVDPGAPVWAHLGAGALLYLHIGGGVVGILAGTLAIAARKGHFIHRTAGKVFFGAMFVTYLIGAGVAPFLTEGQRPNFVGGVLALYMLITGWRTARRNDIRGGLEELLGFLFALVIAGTGVLFMQMGAGSPTGTVDGSPPEAFFMFALFGFAAAAGELNVLMRRRLSATARVARHLWRMCVSLFIAASSIFLGQPQVFPEWFNASPLPALLSIAPLIIMFIWLVIVRFFWGRSVFVRG